jgi:hypothetical protein
MQHLGYTLHKVECGTTDPRQQRRQFTVTSGILFCRYRGSQVEQLVYTLRKTIQIQVDAALLTLVLEPDQKDQQARVPVGNVPAVKTDALDRGITGKLLQDLVNSGWVILECPATGQFNQQAAGGGMIYVQLWTLPRRFGFANHLQVWLQVSGKGSRTAGVTRRTDTAQDPLGLQPFLVYRSGKVVTG